MYLDGILLKHVDERHELGECEELGEVGLVRKHAPDDALQLWVVLLVRAVWTHVSHDVTQQRVDLTLAKPFQHVLNPHLEQDSD